jgi:hypothetical protein
MKLRTRLQQLERRVAALPAPRPPEESPDDEFLAWCRGGCLGPLPPAGSRPALYGSDEAWQQHRRYLMALCCREVGRPDPPGMSDEERREVDETIALVASIVPKGERSLPQQARLAPNTDAIIAYRNDPHDDTVAAIPHRGESPCE